MKKIDIKDLNKYYDKEIELQAFVDNVRNLQYVRLKKKMKIIKN